MQRFKKWLADNALDGEDTVILAMSLDDPLRTEASQCRYDVCTIYPEERPFDPALVEVRELTGGKYVTFLLQHTAYALKTAWQECFAVLPALGYTLDGARPIMERYQKALVADHYCELCMPVL